jgi:hypothetical protein
LAKLVRKAQLEQRAPKAQQVLLVQLGLQALQDIHLAYR